MLKQAKLRILILEDSELDARLLIHELQRSGIDFAYERVETSKDLEFALESGTWDIILSDYSMPRLDAPHALKIVREQYQLDTPFIIISGTIGEDVAVTAMKAGANDFFAKNKLTRLIPVIERELGDARNRRSQREAELRFAKIFDASPVGIAISSYDSGVLLAINPCLENILGYLQADLVNTLVSELPIWKQSEERQFIFRQLSEQGSVRDFELTVQTKAVGTRVVLFSAERIEINHEACVLSMFHDITERKLAESSLERSAKRLEILHQIDRAILRAESPEQIAQIVLGHLEQLAYTNSSVVVYDSLLVTFTVLATNAPIGKLVHGSKHLIEDKISLQKMLEKQIHVVDDIRQLEQLSTTDKLLLEEGILSYARIPLLSQDRLLGSLNLRSKNSHDFSQERLEIPIEVAAQLAIAIENNRLLRVEQQRNVELTAIHQASLELTSNLKMENVLNIVLDYAILLFNAKDAYIFLYDGVELHFGTGYWGGQKQTTPLAQPRKKGLTYDVANSGQRQIVSDARKDPRYLNMDWLGAIAAFPLKFAEKVIGVMNIAFSEVHYFEAHEIRSLELLADQAAIAIHNAQVHAQLEAYTSELELRVSERTKELAKQKDRLEAIVNNSSDAILTLNIDGTIRQANPAFYKMFSRDDSVLGQSVSTLFESNNESLDDIVELLTNAMQTNRLELKAVRENNQTFELDALFSPLISEAQPMEIVLSLRDISLRKQTETELRKALEREKELNELKTQFSSMISHEFRTPLSVINTSAEILLHYEEKIDGATRKQRLEKILQQVKRLNRLMTDVLLVGKAHEAGFNFQPKLLNLAELSQSIIDDVIVAYPKKKVLFQYEGGDDLRWIDEDLYRHILQNLLSNALKYSPEQPSVALRIVVNEALNNIYIKDEGIGMPEGFQKNLFKTFHRAKNVGAIQGTGLGLAIVKHAVDRHGGSIHVRSVEGEGTLFIVNLPNIEQMS